MRVCLERTAFLIACLLTCAHARAEILVRWDQNDVVSRDHLGVSSVVIPATNQSALRSATANGFTVYLEIDTSALASFTPPAKGLAGIVVTGRATAEQLGQLRSRVASSGTRVLSLDDRAQWPHIRSNVVTVRNDVLQVGSRTAQPWLEHNVAFIRLARARDANAAPLLSYRWNPSTASEAEVGPPLEKYLVAIAEAGSTGADLVLPLHERLQNGLLLGTPSARAWWREIRRYIDFYSWNLVDRYRPLANIAVVTSNPPKWVEVMKLLARHNLAHEVIEPAQLPRTELARYRLLIAPEQLQPAELDAVAQFAKKGGRVMIAALGDAALGNTLPWRSGAPVVHTDARASYHFGEGRVVEVLKPILDPNRFALEVREVLGREHRIIDIWNGITVLASQYEGPGGTALITAVNYAHEAETVQLRIAGTYSVVEYESPEQEPALLPYTHRNGFTEFVLPVLRVGGRVFLSRQAGLN